MTIKGIHISKKMILAVFCMELLGAALIGYDYWDKKTFDGIINRPSIGEAERIEVFHAKSGEIEDDIQMEIAPITRSKKEAKKLIYQAIEEIDQSILGENQDINAVQYPLVIKPTYCDGKVKGQWEFDHSEIINHLGEIEISHIQEETIITATCTLSVDNETYVYDFPFRVVLPAIDSKAGYQYYLEEALQEVNRRHTTESQVELPRVVNNREIWWSKKSTNRGFLVMGLGILTGGLLVLAEKEDEKKTKKKNEENLTRDYPEIVSNLSLFVGAGISAKSAFKKIGENYIEQKLKHNLMIKTGYEEVLILNREIEDGKGEMEAYRLLGERTKHRRYRKLSLILRQNLRKGNAQLLEQLEKEEREVYDERKARAKIAGEEASTKLLLPMFGLLMIVLVVLIYPAFLGFQM